MTPAQKRRTLFWGAGGLVIVAVLAFALRPRPVLVDLETVERGPLRVTLDTRARRGCATASWCRRPVGAASCGSSWSRATR